MTTMMSCKALSVKGTHCTVRVWLVDWQRTVFFEEDNFALQLLWDALGVSGKPGAPLARAIPAERAADGAWLVAHAGEFVARCDYGAVAKHPVDPAVQALPPKEYNKFWSTLSKLPRADYAIETTDERWLAHLRKGLTWNSSALDYVTMG